MSAANPDSAPAPADADAGLPVVHAATYDHLGVILWGLDRLAQVLDQEVGRLERYGAFRVGWDHEAYTYDGLAELAPGLLERMRAALDRFPGRLGVGSCTYGQPLSVFIDGESNVRQLTLAMETVEKRLGRRLLVYITSEHAFHAQLPQLLVGCGFQGAIFRTHFMMYGHNPEYAAAVGWWRGIDGSRIPAVPTYPGQASVAARFRWKIPGPVCTLDNRILTDAISDWCGLTLAAFRRRFGPMVEPLVATRADDPRSEESLLAAHAADSGVRWVLLEDLFGLLPPPEVEFRAAPNDFKVRMPWGYCGNWIWRRSREAEVRVQTAERLAAISHAVGGPLREAEIEQAWKHLLVAQHHDIQICGLEDEARLHLGRCVEASDTIIAEALGAIGSRVGHGRRYVIFNPLPWERTEWVPMGDAGRAVTVLGLGFVAVPEARASGAPPDDAAFTWEPHAREETLGRIVRTQQDGRTRFRLEPEEIGRLRTPFYDAYTAATGGFRLVRSRQTGQDLLAPPNDSGTLAGLIEGRQCQSAGRLAEVRIEPRRAVLLEEGQIGPIPYRSEWTFYSHTPRIDWRGSVAFHGEWVGRPRTPQAPASRPDGAGGGPDQAVPAFDDHEHKLRLRFFPFVGPTAIGIRDLPLHVAETTDRYVQGLYWTAVSDGRVGLALFNRGLMGSVWEPDAGLSSVLAFSLPYVWGTRVLSGEYGYELGVFPFEGDWRGAALHRRALEYNFPPLVWPEERGAADAADVWVPVGQRGEGGAILTALYTRDGRPYARFCEYAGGPAEAALHWMGRPAALTPTDLRHRETGPAAAAIGLRPWQIQTVRIG